MPSFVDRLEIGDVVQAKVVEVLDASQIIINLHGDLRRAQNETHKKLEIGDVVRLRVSATAPLQFRVVSEERKFGRIDIVT